MIPQRRSDVVPPEGLVHEGGHVPGPVAGVV
ncbi:MAG: hypothetical protein QOH08_2131, partial [Chloroflexota bacterium]|nr:hypothetical protein [Chloroflexota bacterium]